MTKAVHVAGGRIVLQLWHVGRISHPSFQPGGAAPIAPSAIRPKGQAFTAKGFEPIPTPRALETAEIPGIVEQYAQAARNAMAAGFDGVEVHAANGYLIDQFLRDQTNKRTDRYGGGIENRSRFLIEVVDAVSAAVGAQRTGVRISPQNTQSDIVDSNPQTLFNYVAEQLSGKGLAYLHIVEGDTSGLAVPPFDYKNLKRQFGGLVIANNGFDKKRANEAIADGRADLIAFGKPFIANPDLVIRCSSTRRWRPSIGKRCMEARSRATQTIRYSPPPPHMPAITTRKGRGDDHRSDRSRRGARAAR